MSTPAANNTHPVRDELQGIVLFIATIWIVFLASCLFPKLDDWGVTPRTTVGFVGIVAMPFLHADLQHILSNTVPLFVLLALLAGSKARSWVIVIEVALLGGALLWAFGRPNTTHIGASGLIFGLIAFLVVSGFLEKRLLSLLIAVGVAFFYGGALISGIVPRVNSVVSWDGHLFGAAAGVIVAFALTRGGKAMRTIETIN